MTSDELLLPSIGFGTYKLRGEAGRAAVTSAIETGYRLRLQLRERGHRGCRHP
ncbi:MAG: hypothetical protein ACTMIG_05545 [Corynebacterium variabile]|uniref:hypothetical protein n=1 Tax=Corynebacterium variabile TaxID=1727 RepID=UPI003F912374